MQQTSDAGGVLLGSFLDCCLLAHNHCRSKALTLSESSLERVLCGAEVQVIDLRRRFMTMPAWQEIWTELGLTRAGPESMLQCCITRN